MSAQISVTDPRRDWAPRAILATTDGTTNPDVDAWAAGWYTARDCSTIARLADGAGGPLDPLSADAPGGSLYGHRILMYPVTRHVQYDAAGLAVVEGAAYDPQTGGRPVKGGRTVLQVGWAEMAAPLHVLPAWHLADVRAAAARWAAIQADPTPDSGDRWWNTPAGRAWMEDQDDAYDRDGDLAVTTWRCCRPDSIERLPARRPGVAVDEPADLLELLAAGAP